MEKYQMTIETSDGQKLVCEILFTYYSEDYQKNYVFFIPQNEEKVLVASYEEQGDDIGELEWISDDEEWEMLSELLDDYYNNSECSSCDGSCSSCSSGCGEEIE